MNLIKNLYNNYVSHIEKTNEYIRINKNKQYSKIEQNLLLLEYKKCQKNNIILNFRDVGFRIYSQIDEDGILLYIFSTIGFTNKILIDIAFGTPYGSNSTNLICNWGFWGLLLETNVQSVKKSNYFFANHPDTTVFPPIVKNEWISKENINKIIKRENIQGDIDLLSLDVDGIDYWLWKELDIVSPRVVVVEAATYLGRKKSITIPYSSTFNRTDLHPDFMGASIPAFIKLAKKKGYHLIACNRYGYNLFFLRDDLKTKLLPSITANDCFTNIPAYLTQKRQKRYEQVKDYPWVRV